MAPKSPRRERRSGAKSYTPRRKKTAADAVVEQAAVSVACEIDADDTKNAPGGESSPSIDQVEIREKTPAHNHRQNL